MANNSRRIAEDFVQWNTRPRFVRRAEGGACRAVALRRCSQSTEAAEGWLRNSRRAGGSGIATNLGRATPSARDGWRGIGHAVVPGQLHPGCRQEGEPTTGNHPVAVISLMLKP